MLSLSAPNNKSNLISGNAQAGVAIFSPAQSAVASGNIVAGNLIGTDAAGSHQVPNQSDGIDIFSGQNNSIGASANGINVISGNSGNGVLIAQISDVPAIGNVLEGNYIGTESNGTTALGNGLNGVLLNNARISNPSANSPTPMPNQIGIVGQTTIVTNGSSTSILIVPITNPASVPPTPSNVISGNTQSGVQFLGESAGNSVEGNYIGVSATGTGGLGNGLAGVFVNNLGTTASSETIGGTAMGRQHHFGQRDPATA